MSRSDEDGAFQGWKAKFEHRFRGMSIDAIAVD
jgi:hypothetical protein